MPDRRSVDELTSEELEEILAIRKREARLARLKRLREDGRVVDVPESIEPASPPTPDRAARTPRSYYHVNEAAEEPAPRPRFSLIPSHKTVRTWRDRFLLLIELGAVVGLIFVVVSLEQARVETNQAVAQTQVVPTPEPTPLITAVVLPSGHRPPTSPGGAAPNFDEVPAHLRAFVQSVTPQPIATPAPGQPTRIQIPAINVDAQVVQGDSWEQLKKGVGHHFGTANPGERGNLVLSAHNDIFGEIFRHLDRLEDGDEIIVSSGSQRYRYVVNQTRIIAPTQVEVMLPTNDPTVTLISCYPYLVDNQRIVVFAQLQ
ncbi:MAG: class D sortase [Chloroflexi bacterium]|nr:class D sortase [Chloroflexota bacterium]